MLTRFRRSVRCKTLFGGFTGRNGFLLGFSSVNTTVVCIHVHCSPCAIYDFPSIYFHIAYFLGVPPNGYITCVVAGLDSASDADTSEAVEMSLEAADSTTSGACFVGQTLSAQ